ncbi:MAG: hypothetical protein RBR53_08080 [Desulforegulaceae bacterium]|nr:hypothetical protein [Desulforegulaceae bacterium]
MSFKLSDVVRFKNEKIFEGAVSLDWLIKNPELANKAAVSFVFHGPDYHGVLKDSVGFSDGHSLQDTVSFTHSIVKNCSGLSDTPFNLAIAGYGTGKSHLAITLAELFVNFGSDSYKSILASLIQADEFLGKEIENYLKNMMKPALVLSLNGMENYDLTAEISRQVMNQVKKSNADPTPLETLRPRFKEAVKRVELMSLDKEHLDEILERTQLSNYDAVIEALQNQNEKIYEILAELFDNSGLKISIHGGESLKDIFDVTAQNYCGEDSDKPFSSILILFDEFGRYAEFATLSRQIAGSGVLQQLFEGIQSNAEKTTFVGFIQFELTAYIQRIAPEFKNDITRVITRYQNSAKSYLSTNLETLIANLIEKKTKDIDIWFDNDESINKSKQLMYLLNDWFPLSAKQSLWSNDEKFHGVIRKGCWPFSPFSIWVLYYLSAAGKHLQERSAISLLSQTIEKFSEIELDSKGISVELNPVDLWSQNLLDEFINSEQSSQQGTIAHSYSTVINKHANKLKIEHTKILQSIVLASKVGLSVSDKEKNIEAFSYLSGLDIKIVKQVLLDLHEEYNIIEWDNNFKVYDILGDAVPKTQFISFLRQRVSSSFDQRDKSELFITNITKWCPDLIQEITCDFAESNNITTKEWGFKALTANTSNIDIKLKLEADNWINSLGVEDKRGSIIYYYVSSDEDLEKIKIEKTRLIRSNAKEMGQKNLPVLIVLLNDNNDEIGKIMAELSVLSNSITPDEKVKFGHLIGAHEEKNKNKLKDLIEAAIKSREYVTGFKEELNSRRIGPLCTEIFTNIYPKALSFKFDGFATLRGGAAKTCHELTMELLAGKVTFDYCSAKSTTDKNRILPFLKNYWDCFSKSNGKIIIPKNKTAGTIVQNWKNKLESDEEPFIVSDELISICRPPYGANIVSAGVLLGVFLCNRTDKIRIIKENGSQVDIYQWIQNENDLFSNKCLDMNKLGKTEIIKIGETSSEWEELLEEWGEAEKHQEKIDFYNRAFLLEKNISTPSILVYQYKSLKEDAKKSKEIIEKINNEINYAWVEIEKSIKINQIDNACWQVGMLKEQLNSMISDGMWLDTEIKNVEIDVGKGRQIIIENFNRWISSQILLSDEPEDVSRFNNHLGRKLYGRLKLLELDDLALKLREHVEVQLKHSRDNAEARRLIDSVNSFMIENSKISNIAKINDLKTISGAAKEFNKNLQSISKKVKLEKLDNIRSDLSGFIKKINQRETELAEKANNLWDSQINNIDDIDNLVNLVNECITIYEGVDSDLEDFYLMNKALGLLKKSYNQLNNFDLKWDKYTDLISEIKNNIEIEYGDNELPPWDFEKTIDIISNVISEKRKIKAKEWLVDYLDKEEEISKMSVEESNRVLKELSVPSPLLSKDELKVVDQISNKAEQRCNALELEWLVQRFKELPEKLKFVFFERIGIK